MSSSKAPANGRPSREIYRPRPARNKGSTNESASTMSHQNDSSKRRLEHRLSDVLEPPIPTPSASSMKSSSDSKASKAKTIQHVLSIIEEFKSLDDRNLILDALDSSKSLSMIQMMKVVRMIHHKALESSSHAHSMTWLCFLIMEKDNNKIFLESLLTCCREWFSQQEGDLRKKSTVRSSSSSTSLWPPFLAFLRELLISLQIKRNNLKEKKSPEASSASSSGEILQLQKYSQGLTNLLLDSCTLLIHPNRTRDVTFPVHLESVLSILRCVGAYLDKENSYKVTLLMNNFRLLLLSDSEHLSSISKKNLLEGIEYRSSTWVFNQNQQVYYFPYTDA